MKCISVVCVLSAILAISLAAPAPIDETNLVPVHNQSPSASESRSARKVREANDQEAAASGGNAPNPAEDIDDTEAEESDRNKRFLPFGGDGQGSAGGSGNFLFDLIRLVAGSGTTEETDEKTAGVGGVAEIDVSPKSNGEGIPGPITRLLVIANRGIANLIQDLILMPILYSVVSRGATVLAKYASCAGNFPEVTEQIISKIPLQDNKLTYSHGSYLFHYICEAKIIYMCITDDEFERSRAFLFLNEVKRRFQTTYGSNVDNAMGYAMNSEFASILANEMKHYSESTDVDTISKVHGELDELKNIMVKNIDNIAMRGERLELLINKTENLTNNSLTYRKTSRNLARSLFWKNVKLYVILGVVVIVIIYIIVSLSCGGLAWQGCLSKK
ncbi:hypothetical protein FQR65_LT02873 [Abscondita terminalis]|nr:hypothetical protein FQR65_LT02873 [Abscondita terminalis]